MQQEDRNPGALVRAGAPENVLVGTTNISEDSANLAHIQARIVSERYGLSWPTARAVAQLAFGPGGAA